ncbi:hypothetical protein HOH45_05710 [bacterium]|nr:hypothetical protein [bacterium]
MEPKNMDKTVPPTTISITPVDISTQIPRHQSHSAIQKNASHKTSPVQENAQDFLLQTSQYFERNIKKIVADTIKGDLNTKAILTNRITKKKGREVSFKNEMNETLNTAISFSTLYLILISMNYIEFYVSENDKILETKIDFTSHKATYFNHKVTDPVPYLKMLKQCFTNALTHLTNDRIEIHLHTDN